MSSVQELEQEQEQKQSGYFLYLYLYLYYAVLKEVMQPTAEPNEEEDSGNVLWVLVLVLVQMEVQAEEQVQVQQRPVFLDIVGVKQHTAVLNVQASGYRQEQVEAHQGEE